jgi:hypothetical protein
LQKEQASGTFSFDVSLWTKVTVRVVFPAVESQDTTIHQKKKNSIRQQLHFGATSVDEFEIIAFMETPPATPPRRR